MSESLGKFVIDLEARIESLESDLGRAARITERQARAMQRSVDEMRDRWTENAKVMGTAFVAAAGAFSIALKSAFNSADEISKMSAKVGMSTEALSAMKYQAGLAGVEFTNLQGNLVRFSKTMAEAAGGGKQQEAVFKAMGLSVRDMAGNLKPADVMLKEVADKFAGYKNGAGLAALATQLFGKSGAEMIPMLKDGAKGFEDAAKEAKAYGLLVSGGAGEASEQFNDNLDRLKESAVGFANQVASRLAPSLAGLTDKLADGAKHGDGFAQAADGVATAVIWTMKAAIVAKGAIEGLTNMLAAGIDTLGGFAKMAVGAADNIRHSASAALKGAVGDFAGAREQLGQANDALVKGAVDGSKQINAAWSNASEGIGDAIKRADELANSLDKPSKAVNQFANVIGGVGPIAKEVDPPIVNLADKTTKAGDKAKKAAGDFGLWADRIRDAYKASEQLAEMAKRYSDETRDITDRMSGADDAQIEFNKALRETASEFDKILELGPPTSEAMAAYGDAVAAARTKMDVTRESDRTKEALKAIDDQLEENKRRWESWADTIASNIMKGGNFLKNLLQSVKQIVAQIIQEWLKTRIVGLFMGGGGGGGFGSLVQAGLGAVTTGSGSSAASTAVDFTSTASGSNFSIMSPSSWVSAGKKLWEGFTSTNGVPSGSSIFGTYMAPGSQYATVGNLNMANAYSSGELGMSPMGGGYTPSTFGYLAAGAAGVYAGYNRWQGSNKDFGGALGAAAYGIGTYGAALGVGAAATTGSLAVGLGAIPVVGWIALAAMAVDYLSGGKLFGTKGKLHHTNTSLDIGAAGFDLAQSYTLKGQKAFFGGTKWTTKNVDPSPEAMAAAQEFYDALKKNREDFAKSFNAQVGDLVGGTFAAEYDKKGNLKKSSSTVLGVTYEGETQDQFAQRIIAENQISVLSQFDSQLSALADGYRKNVDALSQFAAAAAGAQSAFMNGAQFLALGSDQTLSAFMKLAEGMQTGAETIDQTAQRLMQAQAAYDQFVGQFKPATTYVDDFEGALSQINQQMLANIKQANDLARAAGAEGASTKDLANIHAAAAKQFAALVQGLVQSAQSLAYAMGLTEAGTLDQINGEIAALEGKANQASTSVGNFGRGIQDVARKASDAMNLLLGDLSPLNDTEKLQKALQGLYAGTVTQEQVLQIGRRLYASGQQYNDLFAVVSQFQGRGAGGGSFTGGSGARPGGGLSDADRQRLQDLYEKRDAAQAQQDYANAQTLAQQIAEIAAAKGEDYAAVMKEIGGVSADELAKRLHLDSVDQLNAYLDNAKKQVDSAGENTTSIVDAIDRLGDRILGIVHPGEPGGDTGHSSRPVPGSDQGDLPNGGHGGRPLSTVIEENTHATRQLIDRMDRQTMQNPSANPRGLRTPDTVR